MNWFGNVVFGSGSHTVLGGGLCFRGVVGGRLDVGMCFSRLMEGLGAGWRTIVACCDNGSYFCEVASNENISLVRTTSGVLEAGCDGVGSETMKTGGIQESMVLEVGCGRLL